MLTNKMIAIAALAMFSLNVSAGPIACGVPDRVATLDSAEECNFGLGNPDATDLETYYSGDTWSQLGELTSNGTDSYFSATSDIESDSEWGVIPNSGDWDIDASFWGVYEEAVITMHIGNGGGDPDHFAWLITEGETSGTWAVDFVLGGATGGGGLSNLKLWGRGESTSVPEPGPLGLLAFGLLGLAAVRRTTRH